MYGSLIHLYRSMIVIIPHDFLLTRTFKGSVCVSEHGIKVYDTCKRVTIWKYIFIRLVLSSYNVAMVRSHMYWIFLYLYKNSDFSKYLGSEILSNFQLAFQIFMFTWYDKHILKRRISPCLFLNFNYWLQSLIRTSFCSFSTFQ